MRKMKIHVVCAGAYYIGKTGVAQPNEPTPTVEEKHSTKTTHARGLNVVINNVSWEIVKMRSPREDTTELAKKEHKTNLPHKKCRSRKKKHNKNDLLTKQARVYPKYNQPYYNTLPPEKEMHFS